MNRKIIVGIALALILSLGLLNTALAHAELVSSNPAAGAKLTTAPAQVTLVFSEEIDEQGSSFTVTDAKQATVGTGKLDLNDLDHKTVSGTLNAGLGDGVYTVAWEVLTSNDKAEESGTFTFGVNADPGPQPTAAAEETDETTPTAVAGATQPTAASTAQPTSAATARPTVATASGTQPTAAPTGGSSPSTLPTTSDSGTDMSGYLLLVAVLLVVGAITLWRSKRSAR